MTNTTQEQEEEKYPLSLDETLKLAKKVSWREYRRVPQGFSGGGFYGEVENAQVLLNGECLEINVSFESPGRLYREEVCLAKYKHRKFGGIWKRLADREKQNIRKQKMSVLDKLKTLTSA